MGNLIKTREVQKDTILTVMEITSRLVGPDKILQVHH